MKKHTFLMMLATAAMALVTSSCQDSWSDHYGQQELNADSQTDIYQGTLQEFLASHQEFSAQSKLFAAAGIFDKMEAGQEYTVLVYDNSLLEASPYATQADYAGYCISDIALAPADMKDGLGISTWYGKNLWISVTADGKTYVNNGLLSRVFRTQDAFIYEIGDHLLTVTPSVYDQIMQLDDAEYSTFKQLVKDYERIWFDADKCTPAGTNEQGNTIYADSAKGWTVKNTLMDRYTEDGQEMWNMRSESYNTTVLVPSNAVIKEALDTALAKVPRYLGRAATSVDRAKFEKWIVRACFIDRRLSAEEITGTDDIDCVGGYMKDTLEGTKFSHADAAMWRPTVQKVRTADMIQASNGNLFFIDWMKVPNNVIIYRLKSRFYELWNNMTTDQRNQYFRWKHWIDPMIINDAQGSFELTPTMPTMYYHVLTAIPDDTARKAKLYNTEPVICSVTYDGTLYLENNPRGQRIKECFIPAGEYYLRMGFKHSLLYSLSIQFNDTLLIKDMVMYAQGSNYHFDRGSVSVVDNYGESSIGYPEGYNWHDWSSLSEKAQAYDTDGYQVGIVNVKKDGNFTITVSSSDMYYLYTYGADRNTSNVNQLMMYHWCLRPTKNNY